MCGILGVIGKNLNLETALMSMNDRGPDDYGQYHDEKLSVSLGHVRLSILDLSEQGHQPMVSDGSRLVLVYNGEIYNYIEIRDELKQLGEEFQSNSDTEVILKAYKQWGIQFVNKCRGMFSFALLDKGASQTPLPVDRILENMAPLPRVYLVRDRMGIKPLYLAQTESCFVFCSELEPMMKTGLVSKELRMSSMIDYLGSGSIYQPNTIYKSVQHLAQGHIFEIDLDSKQTRSYSYYNLESSVEKCRQELPNSYQEQTKLLQSVLSESVKYHMVSDVQVGAFLSGGVDSSAVAALMSKNGSSLSTFTVGFESDRMEDELSQARRVSQHLGTDHHEIVVNEHDVVNLLAEYIGRVDQPSIDGINTFIVSSLASESVKVVLSGLAGDELFGGYSHFAEILAGKKAHRSFTDVLMSKIHRVRPNRFTKPAMIRTSRPCEAVISLRNFYSPFQMKNMFGEWYCEFEDLSPGKHVIESCPENWDILNEVGWAELRGYLCSTLLRDSDVQSMNHSLELRPLLIDHKLVELALSLPDSSKIRGNLKKAILVEAVKDVIPESCYLDKKKGFELPWVEWIEGPLSTQYRDLLHSKHAKQLFQDSFLTKRESLLNQKQCMRLDWSLFILLGWLTQTDAKVL